MVQLPCCTNSNISLSFSMNDWTETLDTGPPFIFKQCHTVQKGEALHCYHTKAYAVVHYTGKCKLRLEVQNHPKRLYVLWCTVKPLPFLTINQGNIWLYVRLPRLDVHSTNCAMLSSAHIFLTLHYSIFGCDQMSLRRATFYSN